jgi:predicted nucleic acid-binding Zn ribbon protein
LGKEMEKLGDVLGGVAPEVKERLSQVAALSKWSEIVGEELAEHTRPIKLSPELLTVAVPSSVWAQELTMRKFEIIEKVRPYLGDIDVRFVVG